MAGKGWSAWKSRNKKGFSPFFLSTELIPERISGEVHPCSPFSRGKAGKILGILLLCSIPGAAEARIYNPWIPTWNSWIEPCWGGRLTPENCPGKGEENPGGKLQVGKMPGKCHGMVGECHGMVWKEPDPG